MDLLIPNFIKYQLYLLQLENYDLDRYAALLKARGYFPNKAKPLRKDIVWTAKTRALLLMAMALHVMVIVVAALAALAINPTLDSVLTAVIAALVLVLPFYFVLFSGAVLLLHPVDSAVKGNMAKKAQEKISGLKNIKIIGIAGSYGKTTMKEVIRQVLGIKYKVVSTPESVNTPVGIAQFILDKVNGETEVLVVELGEHYQGDIKELCDMVRPDVVAITGINEAHLERMKSLENITATVFEAAQFSKEDALVVLNGDDQRVVEHYAEYTGSREVRFYSRGSGQSDYLLSDIAFSNDVLAWHFTVKNHSGFSLHLLGEYALGAAVAAMAIGEHLGLSVLDVKAGLAMVHPIEHRLQPIHPGSNILVIDDSYNGNPAGVAEAIKVLARFTNRRKIYITPGLVETGSAAAELHREIGRQLAHAADVVILVRDSVTPFIAEGVAEAGRPSADGGQAQVKTPDVIWFDTAQAMHEALKTFIQPGDVVLFQNDWGDQYV